MAKEEAPSDDGEWNALHAQQSSARCQLEAGANCAAFAKVAAGAAHVVARARGARACAARLDKARAKISDTAYGAQGILSDRASRAERVDVWLETAEG